MKKIIIPVVFFIGSIMVLAQDSKFSATIAYPLPIDKNFMGENYNGIIDVGFQYRFLDIAPLKIGFSANGSYLNFKNKNIFPTANVNAYFVQPRLFSEIKLESLSSLRPSFGAGYSFLTINSNIPTSDNISEKLSYGGVNLNLELSYDFINKLFCLINFDYVKLSSLPESIPDVKYNTNISTLKLGVGYRF